MSDLYDEIVKYETYEYISSSPYLNKPMSPTTKEQFTEKLITNPQVRDDFLREFVDEVIDSMDQKDIIRAYAQRLLEDLYHQCDENQEDYIVQECFEQYPYVLERFGVNVTED